MSSRGSRLLLAWLLAALPAVAQPHDARVKRLAGRYEALAARPKEAVLERHEGALEILRELRRLAPDSLGPEDRVDVVLLEAMLRRDLYWLMGERTDGRLPLPGFLYRRVFDDELDREGALAAIREDLDALVRRLGRDGHALGERPDGRRRRLELLERVLEERIPQVLAHAGRYRGAIARAAGRLTRRLGSIRSLWEARARSSDWRPPAGVGPTRFRFLLRDYHLVPLEPRALEAIGRRTAARTEAELTQLARQIDSRRSWREIVRQLGDEHPPLGELPAFAEAELERAMRFVQAHDLVTLSPAALRIRVRAFKPIDRYPFGAYLPPRRPGEFAHYGVPDLTIEGLSEAERAQRLRDNNVYWTRVVTVHEGVPGHHVQWSAAAAHPDPVRRRYYSHVFGEGWALYCEELMYRHGYFFDPRTRLVQLKMRLWRALRMVIDVGLHCGNLEPPEAVDLLVRRVGITRASAEAEVGRYLLNPTRPSSYVLGFLMIEDLREAEEARLGDAFDEKAFHDRLLSLGAIPIALVRDLMPGG